MKKRIVTLLLVVCTLVTVLAGCSTKLYDYDSYAEYILLGNYKSINIDQSDIDNGILDKFQSSVSSDDKTEETYSTPNTDVLIERNDTVTIDYVGKIAGVEFEGGTANNQELTIGSNSFIEGFEDGLIGFTVGDIVILNLKFPEDYFNENYAGKDVEFTVTIKSIKRTIYPEYNDENVAKYTQNEYKTVEEYENSIRDSIIQELLWSELFDICKVKKYPEHELSEYYYNYIDSYTQSAASLGYSLETYVTSIYGYSDVKSFYQTLASYAQSSVKQELIILGILEAEPSLLLSDEDYETAVKALYDEAVASGSFDESYKHFKKHYDDMTIKLSVYSDIVIEFVQENMIVNDDVTKNGFYTNRYGSRYYIDNVMQTGWIEIEVDGEKGLYYFDPETGYSPEKCTLMIPQGGTEEKYLQFGEHGKYIGLYNGTYINSEGTRYFEEGVLIVGWQELDFNNDDTTEKYYFDPETGYMYTGIKEIDGSYHEFGDDGVYVGLIGTGLKLDGENTMYFEDSKLVTGWKDLDTDEDGVTERYYFDPENNGYMVVGTIIKIEDIYYEFDENGALKGEADGLISDELGKRYFADGVLMTGEQTVTDGEESYDFYFKTTDGYCLITEWLLETDSEGKDTMRFYYDGNGHKVKGQELTLDGTTYVFDQDGNWSIK